MQAKCMSVVPVTDLNKPHVVAVDDEEPEKLWILNLSFFFFFCMHTKSWHHCNEEIFSSNPISCYNVIITDYSKSAFHILAHGA